MICRYHFRARCNFKSHLTQILPLQNGETKTRVGKRLSQGHISRTQSPKSIRNTFYYALISYNKTHYLQNTTWLSMFDIKTYKSPKLFLFQSFENSTWRPLEGDHLIIIQTERYKHTYTELNSGRRKMKKMQIQPVFVVNTQHWDFSYFNLIV